MFTQEQFRRRRLPLWDLPGAIYFVTACLEGSIPAQGLLDIRNYREELQRRTKPKDLTREAWDERKWKLQFARAESWLDELPGEGRFGYLPHLLDGKHPTRPHVRHLADHRVAAQVVEAINHFNQVRYEVFGYVIMPTHLHWVFRPLEVWLEQLGSSANKRTPRERIMHTLKLHTARECNRILRRHGTFWQDESYDHCVLDVEELERVLVYIDRNPVKAALAASTEDWIFGAARDRLANNLALGMPLSKAVLGSAMRSRKLHSQTAG